MSWLRATIVLAFGLVVAALLARSWAMESVQLRDRRPQAPSIYDPPAYYQLVEEEVAPHLAYCPLVPGTGPLAAQARAHETSFYRSHSVDDLAASALDAAAAGRCGCSDRLGPLFCLRDDEPLDERLRDRIQRYARMSPLLADLAVPSRWILELVPGSPPTMAPNLVRGSHRQRLPGAAEDLLWTGSVFFRDAGDRPVLVDETGRRHVLDPAAPGVDEEPLFAARGGDGDPAGTQAPHPRTLRLRGRDALVEFSAVPSSGRQVLVVIRQSQNLQVLVDGVAAPVTRLRRVFALERDQQIRFVSHAGTASFRLAAGRSGVLSEMRHTARGIVRVTDPTSGVADLIEGLSGSLGDLLARLQQARAERQWPAEAGVRALAASDVWLTLDAGLQQTAGRALRRYAEDPRSPLNARGVSIRYRGGQWENASPASPRESRRAIPPHLGLVALDADHGELLALGTYPDAPATLALLDRVTGDDEPAALLRAHLRAELARGSLHLSEHVIGSLFKPLFAWSVGASVPALLDYTVDARHDRDWQPDPRRNRLLDQCLIDARRVPGGAASHFRAAYGASSAHLSCAGATPPGREDVCMALARSDTYWFLELAARTLAVSRSGPGFALPGARTADRARDLAYQLDAFCGAQTEPVTRATLCAPARARVPVGFPGTCENQPRNVLCEAMARLGVQRQSVTRGAREHDAATFLGPLAAQVAALLRPDASGARVCGPLQDDPLDAFRWVAPTRPQWSADALDGCTPGIESFVEGGGLNYWNNVHLAQAYGRMYLGDRELPAAVVARAGAGPARDAARARAVARRMRPLAATLPGDPVRAMVLEGLRLAVTDGTLRALRDVAPALASAAGVAIDLRGKTGTIRSPYPTLVQRRDRRGRTRWVEDTTLRKTLLTTLLLEVSAAGRARHFVVLLWLEGLDGADALAAADLAGRFFDRGEPGFGVLRQLVDISRASLTPPPARQP